MIAVRKPAAAIALGAVLFAPPVAEADPASAFNVFFDACFSGNVEAATNTFLRSGVRHYQSEVQDRARGFLRVDRGRELTFIGPDGTLFARLTGSEGIREDGRRGRDFHCVVTCLATTIDRGTADLFGSRVAGAGGPRRPIVADQRETDVFGDDDANVWIWQWFEPSGAVVQAGYYLAHSDGRAIAAMTLTRSTGS